MRRPYRCQPGRGVLLAVGLAAAWSLGGHGTARAQYNNKLVTTYQAQQQGNYCGPATAQMILGSANVKVNPLPTQAALFATIQANNGKNGNYWTNPNGLRATLAANDAAHTYVAYNMASFNGATRTLAYNVDHYGVPGGALINAGGHWVTIVGVNTNVQPALTGANANFTVNGFYVKDPWSGFKAGEGLGRDVYIANTADGWQRSFTPANWGGTWQGKYAFVTDPDPDTNTSNSAPTPGTTAIGDAEAARTMAQSDVRQIAGLSSDLSFENGAFLSMGEQELTLNNGTSEWLVPYYESGATDPSAVVLINAATGNLDQAFWDEGVLNGDSLASFDQYVRNEAGGQFIADNVVPEPSTFVLAGIAIATLSAARVLGRRELRLVPA